MQYWLPSMGGDPRGAGVHVPPPNIFDGPMLKPLNNYCWLCAFSSVPQPCREIAATAVY